MELDIDLNDGKIVIEPATLPVRFERRGHLLVAVPRVDFEPMTVEMVNETLKALRDERALA